MRKETVVKRLQLSCCCCWLPNLFNYLFVNSSWNIQHTLKWPGKNFPSIFPFPSLRFGRWLMLSGRWFLFCSCYNQFFPSTQSKQHVLSVVSNAQLHTLGPCINVSFAARENSALLHEPNKRWWRNTQKFEDFPWFSARHTNNVTMTWSWMSPRARVEQKISVSDKGQSKVSLRVRWVN